MSACKKKWAKYRDSAAETDSLLMALVVIMLNYLAGNDESWVNSTFCGWWDVISKASEVISGWHDKFPFNILLNNTGKDSLNWFINQFKLSFSINWFKTHWSNDSRLITQKMFNELPFFKHLKKHM